MAEKTFISASEFAELKATTARQVRLSSADMAALNKVVKPTSWRATTKWKIATEVIFLSSTIDGKEVVYPAMEITNLQTSFKRQVSLRAFVWFSKYEDYKPEGELMTALFDCQTLGEVAVLLGGKSFEVIDLVQMPRMKFVENGYVEEEGKTSFNPIFEWIK